IVAAVMLLAANPDVIAGMLSHYNGDLQNGTRGLTASLVTYDGLAQTASTYLSFWAGPFLFLDCPRFTAPWSAGVFPLAIAGLLALAAVRLVRCPTTIVVLLVAA